MQNKSLDTDLMHHGFNETLFGEGFSTPRSTPKTPASTDSHPERTPDTGHGSEGRYLEWDQLTIILDMTAESLRAKSQAHEVR